MPPASPKVRLSRLVIEERGRPPPDLADLRVVAPLGQGGMGVVELVITVMTGFLANRLPRLWILFAGQILGALTVGTWPEHVRVIGNVVALGSILGIGLALRHASRRRRGRETP